jgi:N-acetylmuramoyl-L-alanine amidase
VVLSIVGLIVVVASAGGEAPPLGEVEIAQTSAEPDEPRALVVIDPGHGGTNTGAPGVAEGIYEKSVTLALALGVQERLATRGIEVVLTRTDDVYISLRNRVRQANALDADLFVSIHANATDAHTQRGFETYVLSPKAIDVDGRALRDDEGTPREELDGVMAAVLDDVERGAAQPLAASLAADIQTNLSGARGERWNRGVRQASMHVLLGATMPAVLVEVGFIDHPIEGVELMKAQVQSDICDAMADAIAQALTSE